MKQKLINGQERGMFLQAKGEIENRRIRKRTLEGKELGAIGYEWASTIFRDKYQGPEGAQIVRIVGRLGEVGKLISPRIMIGGAKSGRRLGLFRKNEMIWTH